MPPSCRLVIVICSVPGDSKLFDEVDGSGHEQVSFVMCPD